MKMKRSDIFRQKSIERISSPEDLNQYLKVVNPSGWAVLISVLLILAGMLVWCFVGNIERKIDVEAKVSEGVAHFTAENLKSGLPVRIGDTESFVRDVGKDSQGNFIGAALVPEMADGTYNARVVVERISPMRFLFN